MKQETASPGAEPGSSARASNSLTTAPQPVTQVLPKQFCYITTIFLCHRRCLKLVELLLSRFKYTLYIRKISISTHFKAICIISGSTGRLMLLTYLNFLTPKILKTCDLILVTLIKTQPHYSQSSRENASPASNKCEPPTSKYPPGFAWIFVKKIKCLNIARSYKLPIQRLIIIKNNTIVHALHWLHFSVNFQYCVTSFIFLLQFC